MQEKLSNTQSVSKDEIPEWVPRKRLEEAEETKKMISEMQRQVTEGSTWFLVGNTWFEAWRRYVFDDVLCGETLLSDLKESEL